MTNLFNTVNNDKCRIVTGYTKLIPAGVGIDLSGSMDAKMPDGKTRYMIAVQETMALLRNLNGNESMAENVHLYLFTFGNDQVNMIIDGVQLCDVNLEALEAHLLSLRCWGNTPMGRALEVMMNSLQEAKEKARKDNNEYAQPILTLISDGEPTDDMSEAKRRIAHAMEQEQQKLVFLPMGIGNPGEKFAVFRDLLADDHFETPVVRNAQGLREHFRLLGKTVRIIEKGMYVTPSTCFGAVRSIQENAARSAAQHGNPGNRGDH